MAAGDLGDKAGGDADAPVARAVALATGDEDPKVNAAGVDEDAVAAPNENALVVAAAAVVLGALAAAPNVNAPPPPNVAGTTAAAAPPNEN